MILNRALGIGMAVLFLFAGSTHAIAENAKCRKPISGVDKIILDVNTDGLMLIAAEVSGNVREAVKVTTLESLEAKLNDKFKDEVKSTLITITRNRECSERAVIIEGVIPYIQYDRANYTGELTGRIIDCKTKSVLATKKLKGSNRNFFDTPKELGEDLGKWAYRELTDCK